MKVGRKKETILPDSRLSVRQSVCFQRSAIEIGREHGAEETPSKRPWVESRGAFYFFLFFFLRHPC